MTARPTSFAAVIAAVAAATACAARAAHAGVGGAPCSPATAASSAWDPARAKLPSRHRRGPSASDASATAAKALWPHDAVPRANAGREMDAGFHH